MMQWQRTFANQTSRQLDSGETGSRALHEGITVEEVLKLVFAYYTHCKEKDLVRSIPEERLFVYIAN